MKTGLLFSLSLLALTCANFSYANDDAQNNSSNQQSATAGQYMTDSKITVEVKSKLLADHSIKSTDISVTTNNGVVELSGTIPSAAEKYKVERIIKKISGVKHVADKLKVVKSNEKTSNQ